jgi:hypothetical protein
MGFDVYLQCFAGEPLGISRAAIRALFPIDEENSEPDYWSIHYSPTDSCKISVTASESDAKLITSLCVYRPCGEARFWESVLSVLRMGPVMLYWPGGGPVVASQMAANEFPREIAESLGQPLNVTSAREIMDAIRAS